jgi:hypothetical protein
VDDQPSGVAAKKKTSKEFGEFCNVVNHPQGITIFMG